MRNIFYLMSFLVYIYSAKVFAQESKQDALKDIKKYREEQKLLFSNPEDCPLEASNLKTFKNLEYYPIDLNYRVKATFKKHKKMKLFYMKTTSDRLPKYGRYAELSFKIEGKNYKLQAYQNQSLLGQKKYEKHLFIPFTDITNGDGSYGGGRYIDIDIPNGDEVILDFNKSYNPYCAYNSKYSCPIPPRENNLNVKILAGVKNYEKY